MDAKLERFVSLSSELTAFAEVELWGTGMAEKYLAVLCRVVPASVVDALLAGTSDGSLDGMLADARLGPVARNLILLWYGGVWNQLPADWRTAYGEAAEDVTHLTSGDAYRAGLQWVAAGAHAPGAAHQGFGSWTLEPKRRRT